MVNIDFRAYLGGYADIPVDALTLIIIARRSVVFRHAG